MGGTDDPKNIVTLTVKQHAQAHKKLYEKYGKWQDNLAYKMLSGQISNYDAQQEARRMGRLGIKVTKKTKKILSEKLQGNSNAKDNRSRLGRPHTKETKLKLSKAKMGKRNGSYGKIYTKEEKEKMRNAVLLGYAMKKLKGLYNDV